MTKPRPKTRAKSHSKATPKTRPRPAPRDAKPLGPRVLIVLSDSTGNLARHMIGAALTQFPVDTMDVVYETFVRTPARLAAVLEKAAAAHAALCHAVVSQDAKKEIAQFCRRRKIPSFDITGGLTDFIGHVAGVARTENVAALHRLDEAYKRRIEAIEFTLAHDDGLGVETVADADIVLAGVSRTGKTPTSIYLAQQGYRVANVALAIEVKPPIELLKAPSDRIVGLLIDPMQLATIRAHRQKSWQMSATAYGDLDHVAREVAWARRLYNEYGWKCLDVTDQAIEETAARILEMVNVPIHRSAAKAFSNME